MRVTATPTNQAELKPLSAKLGVIYINNNTSATWTGTFIDNATSPKDLDGFNYRLSGSGEGTVTLTWNTNYVDISPWFKNTYDLTISKDSSGIATATLKVNSAEKINMTFSSIERTALTVQNSGLTVIIPILR